MGLVVFCTKCATIQIIIIGVLFNYMSSDIANLVLHPTDWAFQNSLIVAPPAFSNPFNRLNNAIQLFPQILIINFPMIVYNLLGRPLYAACSLSIFSGLINQLVYFFKSFLLFVVICVIVHLLLLVTLLLEKTVLQVFHLAICLLEQLHCVFYYVYEIHDNFNY